MFEQIQKIAEEKLGSPELAQEFMNGLLNKLASADDPDYKNPGFATSFGRGLTQSLGKGIGTTAVALGASAVGGMVGMISSEALHQKFLAALNKAIQMNKVIKQADRSRVINYGETIFKFAPHVATDANLLSSILANAVAGDGIDPMTIRTLTELEGRYKDTISFTPKNWI